MKFIFQIKKDHKQISQHFILNTSKMVEHIVSCGQSAYAIECAFKGFVFICNKTVTVLVEISLLVLHFYVYIFITFNAFYIHLHLNVMSDN